MTNCKLDLLPLVSLCITTYNQRNYVAESIRSALAQDYENLEIVVSDDCSTDGTREIIAKAVYNNSYHHKVKLLMNTTNVGVIKNYERCFKAAKGTLLITGAGDDISYPSRVSVIVKEWVSTGRSATVILHAAELIDTDGNKIGAYDPPNVERPIGAMMAYDRRVIDSFADVQEPTAFEDDVFAKRALLLGEPLTINKVLMRYRIGSGESTAGELIPTRIKVATRCLASALQAEMDMRLCSVGVTESRLKERQDSLNAYKTVYSSEIKMITGQSIGIRFLALNRYIIGGKFGLKRWIAYLIRYVVKWRH